MLTLVVVLLLTFCDLSVVSAQSNRPQLGYFTFLR